MVDYNGPVQKAFEVAEALWVMFKEFPWKLMEVTPGWVWWIVLGLFFVFGTVVLALLWKYRFEFLKRRF